MAREGDIIVLSVSKTLTGSQIKKGDVMRALVVRTVDEGRGVRAEKVFNTEGQSANDKTIINVKAKRGPLSGYRQIYNNNSVILVKMGTSSAAAVGSTGTNKVKKIREVTPIATRAIGPLGDKVKINKNNSKVTAII